MVRNIIVAKSWNQLNPWQLQELAKIFFNLSEDFSADYRKMIIVLFQKKPSFMHRILLQILIRKIPIEEMEPDAKFLLEKPDYYIFPEIKNLVKPADRLGDFSIKHFSVSDTLFHRWSENKTLLALRRFAASLYRLEEKSTVLGRMITSKKYNAPEFNNQLLPVIAKITDQLSPAEMQAIAFIYSNTRRYIWDRYPTIFPKPSKEDEKEIKPSFKEKQQYMPFSKVIIGIAMDELKPLGNLHESNRTLLYDFMDTLSETIIYHRNKENANGK